MSTWPFTRKRVIPMNALLNAGLLVAAFTLAPVACAASAARFSCAPETTLRPCTPSELWSAYESGYAYRSGSESWLVETVGIEEAHALHASLEGDEAPARRSAALAATLPPSAYLAWQMVSGELSAPAVATAARTTTDVHGQVALLQLLTSLDREPKLVKALAWTLDQDLPRSITFPWLLRTGSQEIIKLALDQVAECSQSRAGDCMPPLPEVVLFDVSQLKAAWPHLTSDARSTLLSRTSAHDLEAFLRRRASVNDAASLWGDGSYVDAHAKSILATLIMEQLAHPAAAQAERFAVPMAAANESAAVITSPFVNAELDAWQHLASHHSALPTLWSALAASQSPWIALLGAAGLVADNRSEQANATLAALMLDNGAPRVELLRLLSRIDTPAADALFLSAWSVPVTDLSTACEIASLIRPSRSWRMSADLADWVQKALAQVPAELLPPLEDLQLNPYDWELPSPTREVFCLTSPVAQSGRVPEADLLHLARWLDAQSAEFFRIMGAVLHAEVGDLAPMKRLIDTLDTADNPQRQEALTKLRTAYERELRKSMQG